MQDEYTGNRLEDSVGSVARSEGNKIDLRATLIKAGIGHPRRTWCVGRERGKNSALKGTKERARKKGS